MNRECGTEAAIRRWLQRFETLHTYLLQSNPGCLRIEIKIIDRLRDRLVCETGSLVVTFKMPEAQNASRGTHVRQLGPMPALRSFAISRKRLSTVLRFRSVRRLKRMHPLPQLTLPNCARCAFTRSLSQT